MIFNPGSWALIEKTFIHIIQFFMDNPQTYSYNMLSADTESYGSFGGEEKK